MCFYSHAMADKLCVVVFFFVFNDTATTEIYTLSLHDALPICRASGRNRLEWPLGKWSAKHGRSEEHTSELQSHSDLVCRLLLEKKNKTNQRGFNKGIPQTRHLHGLMIGTR